jgi:glycosyltransferase involved in cell wall biosynthesis
MSRLRRALLPKLGAKPALRILKINKTETKLVGQSKLNLNQIIRFRQYAVRNMRRLFAKVALPEPLNASQNGPYCDQRDSPRVTVMIPTYNQAPYLLQALDSVLTQTYQNLEIIVSDDASTDQTENLIRNVADPRVIYLKNEFNIGRVSNYYHILHNYASGDYVVNLDADDYFTDSSYIEKAVLKFIKTHNCVMVIARATRKLGLNEVVSYLPKVSMMTGLQILSHLPCRHYLFMHMAVVYSRREAIECNFYRLNRISSDWESIYRLALVGNVSFLDENIGVWRIHSSNESSSSQISKHVKNLDVWPAIYQEAKSYGMNDTLADYRCYKCMAYFTRLSFTLLSKNGNLHAYKFLRLVFRKNPVIIGFLFLSPASIVRIFIAFFGFYRKDFR